MVSSTQSREHADSDITHFTTMEVDVDAFTRPGNSMHTLRLLQTIVASMEQTQRIALTLAHKNNQIAHLKFVVGSLCVCACELITRYKASPTAGSTKKVG